jgi:5'-3' exonuclease
MGIPSYFSQLVRNHGKVIKKMKNLNVHNFYLDSNSIIYDCLRKIISDGIENNFEKKLISRVCKKIDEYIKLVEPENRVIIAFDGVAPVAKLEQQRNRRYKSVLDKQYMEEYLEKTEKTWDKTAITPGTNFMNTLTNYVTEYYKKKKGSLEIIVSGTDKVGEGEHKIFDFIRQNSSSHKKENTIIYGLDADLIMLCLNHLHMSRSIYLFRETPEFIKSIDSSLEPNKEYYLDIPMLSQFIIEEMCFFKGKTKNDQLYIQDYILLCFFLGNDFMPHFPALNIRTGGINKLLNAYKNTLGKTKATLYDGEEIVWGNVRKLIEYLIEYEHDYILEEYKVRERMVRKCKPFFNTDEQKFQTYLNIPILDRSVEEYINPSEKGWECRYYEKLFGLEINKKYRKEICVNYLEGLEWTMKYYTTGCPDWRWCYHYDYPPLLCDLIKYVPSWREIMIEENNNKPVSPIIQLCYVLPKECNKLIPKETIKHLTKNIPDYYEYSGKINWSFCRYLWESHIQLPNVDIDRLENIIESVLV